MQYHNQQIAEVAELLKARLNEAAHKADIMRSVELRALFDEIKTLPADQRRQFGQEVNALRQELEALISAAHDDSETLPPIDVTAPFDTNVPVEKRPHLLTSDCGSKHPLMTELATVLDIFYRMGFTAIESRQLDDDYHMFTSLNFPEDHPARDDYDTFMTTEGLIAPAQTSTMQHRVLSSHIQELEAGRPIAAVIPGRVFRNEDLDARHEHTFYQFEGIYVNRGVNAGHLIATLKTFLQEYYGKELKVKTQPFYFPFTEPSFEFAISCPFCEGKGCHICSQSGWIELLGCGMIHPNVLHEAGIDTNIYTGFAWGCGLERLVMMKYGIEDIRHFESGNLNFLRQFK
ncbi:MAG TPA: phenylalanine--tRNA ligase subunit alpha [Candidatus Saccharimonadales bacterium]|nr:phenylalanine--tRNA ligase subunit alpha [Candidatus Saccharimonadales bacterium]